ncbi:MAG: hypothetical protein ACREJO_19135 [Phycisphaerales bacterium]
MGRSKSKSTEQSAEAQQRAALLAAVAATTATHQVRPAGDKAGVRESVVEPASPQTDLDHDTDDDQDWGQSASDSRTGLERYRGAGRRLSEFGRNAEEGELNREQFMFVMAIDAFKKSNGVPYPSWTDVLEVVRLLGYRKTQHSETKLRACEDWTEPADAKSNVRPYNWDKRAA